MHSIRAEYAALFQQSSKPLPNMNTIDLLNNAIKKLEQNVHLVKAGLPRDTVLEAIAELQEVRFKLSKSQP